MKRRQGTYDAFELEVMATTEEALRKHALRPVLIGLVLAIAVGCVGTFYSIQNARTSAAASKADVIQNRELTEQLAASQEQNAAEAKRFREDSRLLTLAICDQIEAVSDRFQLNVPPCPRVGTNPMPSPSASPR